MALWILCNGIVVAVAYLLGATPTGYLAGRLLKGIDIREHGSKSIGATNVLRTLGKGPAIAVLLIDILKGVAAIALPRWLFSLPAIATLAPTNVDVTQWVPWIVTLSGLAAIVGHSRSIWIGFKGGKSAATGLGVLLAMTWPVGLATIGVFAIVLAMFKIVSLGSITAAIAAPLLMWVFNQPLPYGLLALAAGLYVVGTHRANIQRLLSGTEPQIGRSHPSPEPEDVKAQP
jgi:glycerol-3-phosphate acyltransferase PlsY